MMPEAVKSLRKPLGVEGWVAKLSVAPLPLLPYTRKQFLKRLKTPQVSASKLAYVASVDPVIQWHLIHGANKALADRDGEAGSVEHAISLLGLSRVQQLIRNVPTLTDEQVTGRYQGYANSLAASQLAACLARQFAEQKHYAQPHLLVLSAGFSLAPQWALWSQARRQMEALQKLRAHPEVDWQEAQRAVLGCLLEDLLTPLAKAWKLPSTLQEKPLPLIKYGKVLARRDKDQRPRQVEMDAQLLQWIGSPPWGARLAGLIAEEGCWNWLSDASSRHVLALANHLNCSDSRALATQRRGLMLASSEWPWPQLEAPGNWLQQHGNKATRLVPMTIPELDGVETVSAVTTMRTQHGVVEIRERFIDKACFQKLLTELKQQQGDLDNGACWQRAVTALHKGVGLERVSVLLLNDRRSSLQTGFGAGLEGSADLAKYTYKDLNRGGSLFARLLLKAKCIRVSTDNIAQISSMTPGSFKQASQAENFFLASVFVGDQGVGLIYADSGDSARPLQDWEYRSFRQAIQLLTGALEKASC